jgi:hypothetical protein
MNIKVTVFRDLKFQTQFQKSSGQIRNEDGTFLPKVATFIPGYKAPDAKGNTVESLT